MASIIEGYEYDIFISYRHNDNRSGWVTEIVAGLQKELVKYNTEVDKKEKLNQSEIFFRRALEYDSTFVQMWKHNTRQSMSV